MNLWWITIGLFIIAIILLIIAIFKEDNTEYIIEEKLAEIKNDYSDEFLNLKNRVTDLENNIYDTSYNFYENDENEIDPDVIVNEMDQELREDIITEYGKGYTMQEISNHVGVSMKTVQAIIDDYIENR